MINVNWPFKKNSETTDLLKYHRSVIPPTLESFRPFKTSINIGIRNSNTFTPALENTFSSPNPYSGHNQYQYVIDINDALVYKGTYFVIDSHSNAVLYNKDIDHIFDFENQWESTFPQLPSTTVTILKGVTFVLSGTWWTAFWHFFQENIWRIGMLERFGYYFTDIDHVLVDRFPDAFHMEWLTKLGIADKIVIAPDTFLQCERLLITPWQSHVSLESIAYLKNKFPTKPKPSRRIYVVRGENAINGRRCVNENEFYDLFLKDLGYERLSMDGLTLSEEIEVFSTASHIIAPNGAALSNMIYCSQRVKILVLYADTEVHPVFFVLANQMEIQHYHLLGEVVGNRIGLHSNYMIHPNEVDMNKFINDFNA